MSDVTTTPLEKSVPLSTGGAEQGFEELTFLTTDIVGSAELHRRYPQDMAVAMDLHDTLVHGAIRDAGGDPFKHTGDGVLAKFMDPAGAIQAVVAIQRAMQRAPWQGTGQLKLRCGIHTGQARPRAGDYFGPALSTVHRLEGAAQPDQILISDISMSALEGGIAALGVGARDLGEHHFKGIDPLRVFQITAQGLADQFAPIGGKRETVGGNLPARLTSFVGRHEETALLQEKMAQTRILTLVGPGGIGKTCMALEVARLLQPQLAGGAWILNLAALERETELWPVIASTLEIDPVQGADRRQQVIDRLRKDKALVVIDNCEHLLDDVADVVSDLATSCPGLSVLATSRQILDVPGEAQYNVPDLAPKRGEDPAQSAAVQLFVDRAQAVRHDFRVDAEALAHVQSICRDLDYIPLAIEIAAGQVRRHPLDRIAKDAVNPLDLVPGKARRRSSDRQQTLRRTLQWSYDLIDDVSRQTLDRLSVFSSPFHEEQALSLCQDDGLDEVDVLDSLDELIDASLMAVRIEDERRIVMLRAVQAFGREKLEAAGALARVEKLHAETMVARVKDLGAQFVTADERLAAAALQEDMPNIRAAFERALTRDLELASRITWPLLLYTYFHRESETASWPARIVAQPGAEALADAPIMFAGAAAYAFHELGDSELARAHIARGMALEQAGHNSSQGWLSHIAGQVAFWMRDTDAFMAHHKTAVSQARAHNDIACQVVDLAMAAFVAARIKDTAKSRALVAELDEMAPALLQPTLIGYTHFARGGLASADNLALALNELQQAVDWAEIGGNPLGIQRTNRIISDIKAIMVKPQEALSIQIEALRELPETGATIYNWTAISRLLGPLAKLKAFEELAVLSGALEDAPLTLGGSARGYISKAKSVLEAQAFEAAAQKGRGFDQSAARAYAIGVVGARV